MSNVRAMGTKLIKTKSGDETENYEIGSLTSIGEIGIEATEIDVTTLDSPDGAKEYIQGDKEAGELALSGIIKKNTDEATVTKMLALLNSGSVEKWEIEFTSGAKWAFDGFVKSFKTTENTTDGNRGFTGSIRISGNPVYTPAV